MHDIRLAIGLITFGSMAVFLVTFRLLKFRSKRLLDAAAVMTVVLMFLYGHFVWGQLWIVKWIPLPSVIVLSNWFPLLLGALAAIAWLRLSPASTLRRLPIMLLMLGAGVYSVFYFIPRQPPECANKWVQPLPPQRWPVCLQTTPNTCSAASSATILNTLGIKTSEQEMAELCLTQSGTTWLGLYHGLSTKLLGKSYHIEFFETDINSLKQMSEDGPLLLCCKLEPSVANRFPEYETEGGWIPGAAHSVVYFGTRREMHVIGDPSQGYESWRTSDLENLWTGTGLRVVQDVPSE